MNEPCLTELLKFIGNHDIRSIDIVPDYLCADDTSNNSTCVNPNSHIQIIKIQGLPNSLNSLDHG